MSGTGAMQVCGKPCALSGCTARESELCAAFASSLVRFAAGVIVAERPAAIFTFQPSDDGCGATGHSEFWKVLLTYREEFGRLGVSIDTISVRRDRFALLVYRLDFIEDLLGNEDIRLFLERHGYDVSSASSLVRQFSEQLASFYTSRDSNSGLTFPHALGIILGYPLEDVIGFMTGAHETCCGPWKAYGDESVARRRFERFENTRRDCLERFRIGWQLRQLFPQTPVTGQA
jgi:hypothetical protein